MPDDFKADHMSLVPPLTRRGFIGGSIATGFALAAGPVQAQTMIMTDAQGLAAGEAKVPVAGGSLPVYYARPASGSRFPTVIVVQEIFGVHEHIKDVCRRLAKLGYLAAAPELYFRQGDAGKISDIQALLRDIVAKVPDAQVMADVDATVTWAGGDGRGDVARLGITGFCWGGRIVWMYAAHNPGLKAGVAWYGRVVGQPNAMSPTNPIDLVAKINAPVLGLYGGADSGIPVATVEQMKAALAAAGKTAEFVVYPDTPHAFYADYRPSYREAPAKDGWKRLQDWFRKHGVA